MEVMPALLTKGQAAKLLASKLDQPIAILRLANVRLQISALIVCPASPASSTQRLAVPSAAARFPA